MKKTTDLVIGDTRIPADTTCDTRLKISETYTGDEVAIPIRVMRAKTDGPTVFLTAAVHGDELNGTGIIHELIYSDPIELERGTLILIPVVNVTGFENHERYMPDRRDLNRSFPGSPNGSLTARVAHIITREIVKQCDLGIDLHTAATHRTNFPNVRGDLRNPEVKRLAQAFGCELVVEGKGPIGSLRREACKLGCPTLLLEAGEPLKLEPAILETGVRGIRNVLTELKMISGPIHEPPYRAQIRKTTWVRAELGGIIRFHVNLGDLITTGQPIASSFSILGKQQNSLLSPVDGIVLGLTTLPATKPGEPICHLAPISQRLKAIRSAINDLSERSLHRRVRNDLATNFTNVEPNAQRD